jgi:hypothetical protein
LGEIFKRGGVKMSLAAYDKGLLNYLKGALNFPNIINSAESKAFDSIAELMEDITNKKKIEIQLPMISFWRIANPITEDTSGSFGLRHRGQSVKIDTDSSTGTRWRSLPVNLSYQITIWSDKRREVDDIYRELIMYLITDNPYISVQLEGMTEPQEFALQVVDSDTSTDVDSFSDKGRIYTQNIMVDVPSAQLIFSKDYPIASNIEIRTIIIE